MDYALKRLLMSFSRRVDANPERQTGRKAQISNIMAAKTVADVIRSCLGPKAMLKMLLDPMGGILYASFLISVLSPTHHLMRVV